jgi:non-specific protein-tyrosine kinase
MLAIGAAFLLEYLHDTIQTPEDVSRIMGLTTIGSISRYAKGHDELIEASRPNSQPAEAYRVLAANLCFALADASLHTVVVTSALGSEGKSETAANLAVAMARTGYRVIVVDGDLRRPRLHRLFGLPQGNGLGESLLLGQLDGNLQQTGINGLQVLTSGVLASDPIQLISSSRMDQLLAKLARTADFVIIDSPPVLGIADAAILASKADAVLLVVRANRTSRQAVQHAAETLRRATSRLVRVVLNGVPARHSSYYGYYGYKSGSREPARQPQAGRASNPPPQDAPPVKQGQPAGGRAAIQKR